MNNEQRVMRFIGLAGVLILAASWATAQAPPVQAQAAPTPYKVEELSRKERVGVTRNIEVELHRDGRNLQLVITALEGNQFALRQPGPSDIDTRPQWMGGRRETPALRILAPRLYLGDSGIRVNVNPEVGFTAILSLKILDPVILNLRPDGIVEADRAGVRAVLQKGRVQHSACFIASAELRGPKGEVQYDLRDMGPDPKLAEDGSLIRVTGAKIFCPMSLEGREGARFVSQKVTIGDKPIIAFAPVRETK